MKNLLVTLLLSFMLLGCGPKYMQHEATRPPPTIGWIEGKNAAEAIATAMERPLFSYYPNEKCTETDKKTLSDTEVVILVQDNFVPFKGEPVEEGEPRFEIKTTNGIMIAGPAGCPGVSDMVRYIYMSKLLAALFNGADLEELLEGLGGE